MQTADREQFEQLLESLCTGYEKPCTKQRREAYWAALGKMSLTQFSRCIEFALGEHGPDDLPTAKGIWKIHRQLRSPGAFDAGAVHASAAVMSDPDHLEYFANRLLLMHLTHRGGLGSIGRFIPGEHGKSGMNDCTASVELTRCLKFKREIVDEFAGFIREGDPEATPAVFYQWWLSGLRQVSAVEPRTIETLKDAMEHPDAQHPFDVRMARELAPRQAEFA